MIVRVTKVAVGTGNITNVKFFHGVVVRGIGAAGTVECYAGDGTGDPQVGTNVRIDLYKGATFERTIEASTPNDGSYTWTVATDLTAATDYRLWVVDPFDPTNCTGASASDFEIKAFIDITNAASLQVEY